MMGFINLFNQWNQPWQCLTRSSHSGYTMVHGIAKMLNFAHGDIIMVGSYTVFYLALPWECRLKRAPGRCHVHAPRYRHQGALPTNHCVTPPPLSVLITAIGVSYLLQNVALLLFGADTKSFTSVVTFPAIKLADGAITITGEIRPLRSSPVSSS